ncbi:hypothetical protein MJO29_012960 [Puccinia striiformis f. sp. tritici]|nr:hypothetical protein MJO29_012960 [Puccinia striiformis f. sp. tritici]
MVSYSEENFVGLIKASHLCEFQVERAVDLGPITGVLKEILNPSFKDSLLFRPITLIHKLKNLDQSQIKFSKQMRYPSQEKEESPTKSGSHHHQLNLNFDEYDDQITKTIDSKSDVDIKLKMICHEFIMKSSALICSNSLEPFMIKCQNHLNLSISMIHSSPLTPEPGTLNRNLGDQEWASHSHVRGVFQNFIQDLHLGLSIIFNWVALYFHDDDHHNFNLINVLFPLLQEEILEQFEKFYSLIRFEFDFNFINPDINKDDDDGLLEEVNYERVLNPRQVHKLTQKIVYRQSSSV